MDEDLLIVKRPTWNKDQLELLCGIANAGGGRLVITSSGTDRRKGIRRIRKSFETIPVLTQRELGITCTTEPVMDGMQLCLEIVVPPANEPVSYLGNYYLYTDGMNKQIDGRELDWLLTKSEDAPWEERAQPFIRQEDLDPEIIQVLAEILGEDSLSARMDTKAVTKALEHYGIKNPAENAFTNLGVLLLHKSPQNYIHGATVHVGFFDAQGNRVGAPQTITGPLTKQLERTLELMYERTTDEGASLQDALSKAGVILPPREAMHEALLNALVHKDYEDETPIRISIHPDVVYISNVGRPPEGWTEEDLKKRHNSRPNNPALTSALQKSNTFNGWGTGTLNMIKTCTDAGLPEPSFDVRADEIEVSFPLNAKGEAETEQAKEVAREESISFSNEFRPKHARYEVPEKASPAPAASAPTAPAPPTAPTTTEAKTQKNARPTFKERSIAAKLGLDMTSTDEYILKVLETNGRVTAVRIAEVLGVSESTVRRSFRKLKDFGFIERIGSDKAGYWRVK